MKDKKAYCIYIYSIGTAQFFTKLSFLFFFTFVLTNVQAQETISASGASVSGNSGSLSYSVGQLVYSQIGENKGSAIQGVHQPYEISVVSGINLAEQISLSCSVYPNPTSDYLTLELKNYNDEDMHYQLLNLSGKLLETKKLISNKTIISMEKYKPAIYFLKVTNNNKNSIIFKIIIK
ncbi:MAG: T9SS type A sorting domain-containing protein [Bacteroidales bacterium]|nr:T9SS type A sorting domain-containing protein [Bacteroidales bacterium]